MAIRIHRYTSVRIIKEQQYDKHLYKGHRAETTYQERTDFPLSGFLSSNPQPEDRQALTQGVPWSLHLHQPC